MCSMRIIEIWTEEENYWNNFLMSVVRKAGCTSMEIEISGRGPRRYFIFTKRGIYTEVPLAMTRRHEKFNSNIFQRKKLNSTIHRPDVRKKLNPSRTFSLISTIRAKRKMRILLATVQG